MNHSLPRFLFAIVAVVAFAYGTAHSEPFNFSYTLAHDEVAGSLRLCVVNDGSAGTLKGGGGESLSLYVPGTDGLEVANITVTAPSGWDTEVKLQSGAFVLTMFPEGESLNIEASEEICFEITGVAWDPSQDSTFSVNQRASIQ
jgi:hypothetical protein